MLTFDTHFEALTWIEETACADCSYLLTDSSRWSAEFVGETAYRGQAEHYLLHFPLFRGAVTLW